MEAENTEAEEASKPLGVFEDHSIHMIHISHCSIVVFCV